jgi:hypothetical protein
LTTGPQRIAHLHAQRPPPGSVVVSSGCGTASRNDPGARYAPSFVAARKVSGRRQPLRVPYSRVRRARRADWRFLLPEQELRRIAVFVPANVEPDHRLVRALADGGTDVRTIVVSASPATETHDRDLVVIPDADARCIRWAAAAADTGCLLYAELRRRPRMRFRSPGAITARLRRSGFEPLAVHWHEPDFEHSVQIVPLDSAKAVIAALRRRDRTGALETSVSILLVRLRLFDHLAWPLSITARWKGPR